MRILEVVADPEFDNTSIYSLIEQINPDLIPLYDGFDELEQQWFRRCLQETVQSGRSLSLDYLLNIDYERHPVAIQQFLSDPYYLGDVGIWPKWKEEIITICDPVNRIQEVILGMGIGCGKCLRGITLISTDAGLIQIKDIVNKKMSLKVLTESGYKPIKDYHDEGVTETIRMTTKHGHMLECRPNHRVRVLDGVSVAWKQMQDVVPEDCVLEYSAENTVESLMPDRVAELLGWAVAEGCWLGSRQEETIKCKGWALSLHETELDYVYALAVESSEFLGCTVTRLPATRLVNLYGGKILDFLLPVTSHYKVIPQVILASSRSNQCAFLRGYFSGDGDVSPAAEVTTMSKDLAEQIRVLLTSMGYYCVIRSKIAGYKRDGVRKITGTAYTVAIVGDVSKRKFADEIRFVQDHKTKRLKELCEHAANSDHVFGFRMNRKAVNVLRAMQPKLLPYEAISLGLNGDNTPRGKLNRLAKGQRCTQRLLQDVLSVGGVLPPALNSLADGSIMFDTVKTVEKSSGHCYDLSVDGDPSYVSNGFMSHNTFSAMVIMLYRLYELSCLKHPAQYLGLAKNQSVVFGIYNATLKLTDVGVETIKGLMEGCPYFKEHFWYKELYKDFIFPKGIKIMIGSRAFHVLGSNLYSICLSGDTTILTKDGVKKIKSCVGDRVTIGTVDAKGHFLWSSLPALVSVTGYDTCTDVYMDDETSVALTEDHEVYTQRGVLKVKELRIGDKVYASGNRHQGRVQDLWVRCSESCLLSREKKGQELFSGRDFVPYLDIRALQGKVSQSYKTVVDIRRRGYKEPVYDVINVEPNHVFIMGISESGMGIIGKNCIDEVNFHGETKKQAAAKTMKEKGLVHDLVTQTSRRVESRFQHTGRVGGIIIHVSSTKSTNSYLELRKKEVRGKPGVHIVEGPQWDFHLQDRYCGKRFRFMVGNLFVSPKVLDKVEDHGFGNYEVTRGEEALPGIQVLEVPVEDYRAFMEDPIGASRDIAGIPQDAINPFFPRPQPVLDAEIPEKAVPAIFPDNMGTTYENPVVLDLESAVRVEDFIIRNNLLTTRSSRPVPKHSPYAPRYIHCDLGRNEDALGLAMVYPTKAVRKMIKNSVGEYTQSLEIYMKADFVIQVKQGITEIDWEKVRLFILWLREHGFNIQQVTYDSPASQGEIQYMKKLDIDSAYLSVDRKPDAYHVLKTIINENRVSWPQNEILRNELLGLEVKDDGRIDHQPGAGKDCADALCGAVFSLIKDENIGTMLTPVDGDCLTHAEVTLNKVKDMLIRHKEAKNG